MKLITEQSGSLFSLLKQLLKPFRGRVAVILVTALVLTGISLLTPLVQRRLMDIGILAGQWHVVVECSLLTLALFLLSQGVEFLQFTCCLYIKNMLSFRLFGEALRHIFRLPISYFTESGNAQIINNVASDIGRIGGIANEMVIVTIVQMLKMAGGILGLTLLNWKLGLIVLLSLPVKILTNLFFSKMRTSALARLIEQYSTYYGWLGDVLCNVSNIKLWRGVRRCMARYTVYQRGVIRNECQMEYTGKANVISSNSLDQILQAALYISGGALILSNSLSLGTFFAFTAYTFFVMNTITYLAGVQAHLIEIGPALHRHVNFMNLQEEQSGFLPVPPVVEVLALAHVGLKYDSVAALEDITLEFRRGTVTALVGANGSGKSSLIQLILRLYTPTSGTLLLNGIVMQDILLDEYRAHMSVIEQKTQLVDSTVYENINLNGALSREAVTAAFARYQLEELMNGLPQGIDTPVGIGGSKLSGGERQKIAALRALLKPCQILILDEATSNFDIESEQALHHMLLQEKRNRITIIITHRQEILSAVDRVIFLADGRVAGDGTYEDLLADNEQFRERIMKAGQ